MISWQRSFDYFSGESDLTFKEGVVQYHGIGSSNYTGMGDIYTF